MTIDTSRLPRRVLMTADTVGGVWTYALELARSLAPYEVMFHLATMGAPLTDDQWAEANATANLRIWESNYKLEWMPEPWADVRASGDWLLDLEAEICPDLIHLNGYAHGALPFRAPVLIVGHSCVLSWWEAVKAQPAPSEWSQYETEVRCGLRSARSIAAPTNTMLQALRCFYGPFAFDTHTFVLSNSRDPSLFLPAPPAQKEPFIFTAGRVWDEAKNIAALDQVAADLPWPVWVAGNECEPGQHEAAKTQEQRALANRLGRLATPDLASCLQRATIYALPARYESFGLSILEAAFAGCALVLGDIPSLREVWEDTAFFVPPDDTNALRRCLSRLANDTNLCAEQARKSRAHALRNYVPSRMAAAYRNAYSQTLSAVPVLAPA